jgi:hypothetical protein
MTEGRKGRDAWKERQEKAREPHGPPQLGEPGEHPLSILLFSWMRSVLFFRVVMALLAGFGALLVALEFIMTSHVPGFYALFGFVAFSAAVLSGWPLGYLLRRREDYYDTSSGEAGDDR